MVIIPSRRTGNFPMKFVFSLGIIFFAQYVLARPVILFTYRSEEEAARSLRRTLEEKMNIPPILISLERKSIPCEKNTQAVAHICIEDGGPVKAPWMRYDIIDRNIKPFYQE